VIAIEIPGTLTLSHNIIADDNGFRGGAVLNDYAGGGVSENGDGGQGMIILSGLSEEPNNVDV
jgi:hypothetical protein